MDYLELFPTRIRGKMEGNGVSNAWGIKEPPPTHSKNSWPNLQIAARGVREERGGGGRRKKEREVRAPTSTSLYIG